ncbi:MULTISPECIES: helix-turn-helix domain-containing protein [Paraburkholderia]|uniref:helix-turn-helix domain-containing protein n=1 Tax=Paraburkholderia TaxID=1822464 RepID=UPI002255703A|nr:MULTISPECIES: helix-turn-helix transcriptional regulator [Paraburkholderia]MCX4156169.1 helix-turn-helix transcriptional regulator [Paraburkholderia aspalathi]MDN7165575.1 helix-turn-helix domain-containing protein [Paraburkholderia sp. SECH2]MDQ6394061.1 helix-turn-helix domain-containing protein [Paraburkholderia aspalathi]
MHIPLTTGCGLLRPIAQALRDIPIDAYVPRRELDQGPDDSPNDASNDAQSAVYRRPRRRLSDDESIEELMRERLIVARKLNSLDQKEASAKLGYKNSSQLSKVESGDAPLPKSLLRKAAIAFGVSSDWLLGISNEPEREPLVAGTMGVMRALHEATRKQAERVAVEMLALANDQLPLESHLRRLLTTSRCVADSFDRCFRGNEYFETEVRGGAALMAATDDLLETTVNIERYLDRRNALAQARLDQVEIDYEIENEADGL